MTEKLYKSESYKGYNYYLAIDTFKDDYGLNKEVFLGYIETLGVERFVDLEFSEDELVKRIKFFIDYLA